MVLRRRKSIAAAATLILFLWMDAQSAVEAKKSKTHACPIGFTLSYTKDKEEPICHRLKGPEFFSEKFEDCTGNLFTYRLYQNLNLNHTRGVLWSEFKSLYPGGPFIDWSYTDSTGDILTKTYDVEYDSDLGLDDELCAIVLPTQALKAVRCKGKHFRYCMVRPYDEVEEVTDVGCQAFEGRRFYSPRATCLASITGVGGGNVRATWRQAEDLCERRGGSLLNRGWRYANNPIVHGTEDTSRALPLGVVMTTGDNLLWVDEEDGRNTVPHSEWNFKEERYSPDTSLVSLSNGSWHLINSSYIFYDVICERSIPLRSVEMEVDYDQDGQLRLEVSDSSVSVNNLWCFSDSVIFYPSRVSLTRVDDSNDFVLKPLTDGYYWCIHADSRNYRVSESNRELFIREKTSVVNLYAIKIRVKVEYTFENLDKLLRDWSKKLGDYISLRTMYSKIYGDFELANGNAEATLKGFRDRTTTVPTAKDGALQFLKLKRLFLDGKTALLHALVTPTMLPVPPGEWEGLEIVFMKPAYYCKGFETVPQLPLGESTIQDCTRHRCVGDFNEGVQWVSTQEPDCVVTEKKPKLVETSMSYATTTTVTVAEPTEKVRGPVPILTHNKVEPQTTIPPTYPPTTVTSSTITTVEPVSDDDDDVDDEEDEEVVTVNNIPETTTTTDRPSVSPPTTMPVPPPTPEENLQNVMDNLQQLLQDETVPLKVEHIDSAFTQVDEILDNDDDLQIPSEFLRLLDRIGSRVDLNGSASMATVRNNVALLMADATPDAPVRGLKILARDTDAFSTDSIQIINDEVNSTNLQSDTNEVVVTLPESVSDSERRISFVVFRNDRAFHKADDVDHYAVNSRVLSVNVENVTEFAKGEVINLHFRPMDSELQRNTSRACAYWKFLDDGNGTWSRDGCTFIRATTEGTLDTCQCDHLTHFAEILIPATVFSEANEAALEVLSLIGCFMSIIGILMVGVTALLFRSWRRDFSNKIWLQLCVAILLLALCFTVTAFAKFTEYNIPCMLLGLLMHYSVLASFCWMLVAAILSYRRLVLVFTRDASHKLLRASAFAWGTPCAVVGILLSISPHSYAGRFEEMTPSGSFCYPTGVALWVTVYAPIALMLLANWTLFGLIVRSVFASRRIQRHGDTNEALRCATVSCLLVFLFGLPWVFGLFASNIIGAYLFTLTATFQGFVLFVFFVVGNKKTRDLWLNKLKIKQTRKVPVTSSTYAKSSGPGWRGGSGRGTASIEASASKPRSLATSDDSRFS
ncbi:unnamed protein product [Plutella xylostella]|uniref:(diamondback moth) hypothetical protein n=1 Tax=Plutella xylostella TaxID=51655 RepID=A0A8S4D983_PLUXY|nr:unnamed protein product [Plutella xylostella]